MMCPDKPCSTKLGSEQLDEEKEHKAKLIAEAMDRKDQMTVAMLTVGFFVDKVGSHLGDQCVQLACLSKTIEATAHD